MILGKNRFLGIVAFVSLWAALPLAVSAEVKLPAARQPSAPSSVSLLARARAEAYLFGHANQQPRL